MQKTHSLSFFIFVKIDTPAHKMMFDTEKKFIKVEGVQEEVLVLQVLPRGTYVYLEVIKRSDYEKNTFYC